MREFFTLLEQSGFGQWVRDAPTIWAFPTILVLHTIGMGIVAGGSAMISLMILGFWPAVPIKPFARMFQQADESRFLHQDGAGVCWNDHSHSNAAASIRGSSTRSGPAIRPRKSAGMGIARLLVWRNYRRPLAGVRRAGSR